MARGLFVVLMLGWSSLGLAAYTLGIVPFLSPRSLIIEFAPWRAHLESRLATSVAIATATDPVHFLARCGRGDFDVVLVPPHIALYLQRQLGYRPLLGMRSEFFSQILINRDATATQLSDLKGRHLHLPDQLSLVNYEATQFLSRFGLQAGRDFTTQSHTTENNALLAAISKPGAAAVASRMAFEHLPENLREQLRIIGSGRSSLWLVVMVPHHLKDSDVARLEEAISQIPHTQAGAAYFSHAGVALEPLGKSELAHFEPLLSIIEKAYWTRYSSR
ncbi:PhnD/SsuA/transferrin family substrate-binding protein [Parachitinimonas caeni]|uniref:PhnD/SsuA/transferrin family substrate-binding protein n=1 Tax=Parachitinimonas caeni TaxID=3031301 RepID=A0ABT7DSR3_9NEIS|nr:PhnD/SsuA/transferrin family substrate-binding protein [Parachitinimonas caeni]MDK2123112.1 PhnD/SsuA/transferrin family substrate-binding protein [Parachitinimonas caeni]